MKLKSLIVLLALGVCLLILAPRVTFAQLNLDAAFSPNVTDAPGIGYISTQLPDGKVLVGGLFHLANGVAIRNLVRVNADGSLDPTFNPDGSGPSASVLAIVPVDGNKFLIGGGFATYNGVAQGGIVRINSDGTLDTTFNPGGSGVGPGGTVQTLTLQADGKILISGGLIGSYNGNTTNSIARLNADGTFDSSFVSGLAFGQFIEDIHQVPSGKILISGGFNNYGGVPVKNVVLLSSTGALDTAFQANMGTGPDGTGVFGSEVQPDGKILLGGDFQNFNGSPRNNVARLNVDGTLDTSFVPGTNSLGLSTGVEYFALQPDGKILAAGIIDLPNFRGLIRLNSDGSLDPGFASVTVDQSGYSVSVQSDSKILLNGLFTQVNGDTRLGIVRLNANGTPDPTFTAGVSRFASVNGIVIQPDGKTIVAGVFLYARGVARRNIARFNTNGTLDTTFDPGTGPGYSVGLANNIQNIALQSDGKIIAVGNFGSYNGSPGAGIVRINPDGSSDPSFDTSNLSPLQAPFFNDVAILGDGSLVAAGVINNANGFRRVVHLSSTGVQDISFPNFNINGNIIRLVRESSGSFLIGGQFTNVAGQARPRLARLNSDGTFNSAFNAGIPNVAGTNVQEIAPDPGGNIMIGGTFTTVGGQPRSCIARLLSSGALDPSFNPGTGAEATVFSIARQADGKYFVGGGFSNFNSTPAKSMVLLNSDGSTDGSFTSGVGPNAANFVRRLLFQADGQLLVGGTYNLYAGFARGSLVRLTNTSSAETVTPGDTIAEVGGTTIAFDNVTATGTALVTPISPASVDANLPGNYVIPDLNIAFEIQTTATYTGSIVIAFRVPNSVTASQFAALRILHGEGGTLVDRTILPPDSPAPDFANRTIYARVTSLSPFVIGQIVTPVNKDQCKNNGWQIFTQPSFRNQGDCVSFVQSHSPHNH